VFLLVFEGYIVMNKILFSLVFASLSFTAIQEASAARVLTKQDRVERKKLIGIQKQRTMRAENEERHWSTIKHNYGYGLTKFKSKKRLSAQYDQAEQ
jgi:hypothetical protein